MCVQRTWCIHWPNFRTKSYCIYIKELSFLNCWFLERIWAFFTWSDWESKLFCHIFRVLYRVPNAMKFLENLRNSFCAELQVTSICIVVKHDNISIISNWITIIKINKHHIMYQTSYQVRPTNLVDLLPFSSYFHTWKITITNLFSSAKHVFFIILISLCACLFLFSIHNATLKMLPNPLSPLHNSVW